MNDGNTLSLLVVMARHPDNPEQRGAGRKNEEEEQGTASDDPRPEHWPAFRSRPIIGGEVERLRRRRGWPGDAGGRQALRRRVAIDASQGKHGLPADGLRQERRATLLAPHLFPGNVGRNRVGPSAIRAATFEHEQLCTFLRFCPFIRAPAHNGQRRRLGRFQR
jgi:hypothetical protein